MMTLITLLFFATLWLVPGLLTVRLVFAVTDWDLYDEFEYLGVACVAVLWPLALVLLALYGIVRFAVPDDRRP